MLISNIRKEYTLKGLKREDLKSDPIQQFKIWLQEVLDASLPEPNAMILGTADKEGRPSARTVLLRGIDSRGFSFFTNYESRKGKELTENPNASLVFFWATLERQICIRGTVSRLSREESEAYFSSRPRESQLGAWVSKQSTVIESRQELEDGLKKVTDLYQGKTVPLPSYWGGFILEPTAIEFWQGRPNRLHDRFRYSKQTNQNWKIERLAP